MVDDGALTLPLADSGARVVAVGIDAMWVARASEPASRRDPPVLPTWLAPGFADALRAVWTPPQPGPRRRS